MTQELFNDIQLKRLKIGEKLEPAALEVFLKYPEFALPYSDCLEKAIETLQPTTGISENSNKISEEVYEKIQCVVKESFPYSFNQFIRKLHRKPKRQRKFLILDFSQQ